MTLPARAGLCFVLAALALSSLAAPAYADDPTPAPSPSVSPPPTLSPAQIEAGRQRIEAMSLLARLEAQAERMVEEQKYLADRRAEAERERAAVEAEIAKLAEREAQRREVHARLIQHAYRESRRSPLEVLLTTGSIVDAAKRVSGFSALGDQERSVMAEIRAIAAGRENARREIAAREAEIRAIEETMRVKEKALGPLLERVRRLAAATERGADVNAAELAVVRELAEEAARAREEADRILAGIALRSGIALPEIARVVWPLRGAVTQEFGPSSLTLEPPATYRGKSYPNFHSGIDIAAPLGTPVVATAAGRVAYVGNLSDGAMVVIVAHERGLVSLYGHLDDAVLRPRVRIGDQVRAGDLLGAVGLTGITTGPHVHFSIRRGTEPVDPRSLLPPR